MCEVVTVLARGVGTCVARHPSGVPDNIRDLILFLDCFSHGSAKGEEWDVGSHALGDVGS